MLTGRLSPKNFDNTVDMKHIADVMKEKVGNAFGMNAEDAAMSILRVAESNMFNALKLISVRRGYDPRDFTMVAFAAEGPCTVPILLKN